MLQEAFISHLFSICLSISTCNTSDVWTLAGGSVLASFVAVVPVINYLQPFVFAVDRLLFAVSFPVAQRLCSSQSVYHSRVLDRIGVTWPSV